jgi:hypothetical protein
MSLLGAVAWFLARRDDVRRHRGGRGCRRRMPTRS